MDEKRCAPSPEQWFVKPSFESVGDWRLTQWRGNYDEAQAIARYVRWIALRRDQTRRSPDVGKDGR